MLEGLHLFESSPNLLFKEVSDETRICFEKYKQFKDFNFFYNFEFLSKLKILIFYFPNKLLTEICFAKPF